MKRTVFVLAAWGWLVGCSASEPAVEVNAFVGERYDRSDLHALQENARTVLFTTFEEVWQPEPVARAQGQATPDVDTAHPPRNPEQLAVLVLAIRTGALDDLAGPARRIAAADVHVWPQIRTALLAERKGQKGDYRSLLRAIGGDVPNRYGHFDLAWKKAHGHPVKLSSDWFEDLLALPRARISAMLTAVYRDCVLETALLRAASNLGREHPEVTVDVIATLLEAAYLHEGTFRDEIGRAIVGIGDEAVPTLVEAAADLPRGRVRREDPDVLRAAYARHNLDRMDRLHPERTVAAVRDNPRLLAAVLTAFGTAKMGEAAEVLLGFADDRSPAVRIAARRAFEAYVTGPEPEAVRRTVRLLGGGTGRARAFLSYRQRASMALDDRLGTAAPALLEPACDTTDEDTSDDEACEARPQRLTAAYFGWLDAQRAAAEASQIEHALAHPDPEQTALMLDRLLAVNPALGHAETLSPFYRDLAATRQRDNDPRAAAQLFRKAAMLISPSDPTAARTLRVQALLAEARVPDVLPRGRRMLLETARDLAPQSAAVHTALDDAARTPHPDADPEGRRRLWTHTGLLALGLSMLGVVGGPLRRRLQIG